MLNCLLLTTTLAAQVSQGGLAEFRFDHAVSGNPYDATVNDVRVTFVNGRRRFERLAFFDGSQWRARIRAEVGTPFKTEVTVNGRRVSGVAGRAVAYGKTEPGGGIVRVSGRNKTMLVDERQTPYFALGTNMGWQNGNEPSIPEQFKRMSESGMNWSRVWSNHWDGKNPYWIEGREKNQEGWMYPAAVDRWDEVVKGAEMSGIRFQFVLFHHGPWSEDVNTNWPENPWNAANGGFLKEPREFFTDAKAKKYAKNWLRYAVARYGHSSSVLAWELFNEVEWTQPPRADEDWGPVVRWHKEMAEYLRSIDPDRHLITTSSAMEEPELYASMDYYQPHGYPTSVKAMMRGAELPGDKPLFYGEFGPGNFDGSHRIAVREGIWASVLAGHDGAGCYWFWDRLLREQELYQEFRVASAVLKEAPWVAAQTGRVLEVGTETATKAPLSLRPARGWGSTEAFDVDLTSGDGSETMGKVSAYFNSQSGGNKALFPKPLTIKYQSSAATTMSIRVTGIATNGASIRVSVDGREALSKSWEGGSVQGNMPDVLEVPLPAGTHTVEVASVGTDWFQVAQIEIANLASNVEPMGLGTSREALVWLRKIDADANDRVELAGTGLRDGSYTATVWDLGSGQSRSEQVRIQGGRASAPVRMVEADEIWLIR